MLGRHLAGVGGISCLIIDLSISRAAEKESHAWTPSCWSWRHQLSNNRSFPFPGLQKKKAMLGRHLAGVGGISCLIIYVFSNSRAAEKESHAWTPACWSWRHQLSNNRSFPFPGLQKKKAMLGRHLLGEGGKTVASAV
jgi:hypothetical protein